MKLKQEEYEIMRELSESLGETSEAKVEHWQELKDKIRTKTFGYISVIRKGGLIDHELEDMERRIKEAKELKKQLEEKREYMEEVLHHVINESEEGFIQYDTKVFVKPYVRQNREVLIEKVPPSMGHYVMPKLTAEEFRELVTLIAKAGKMELLQKIDMQKKHNCNVTELPDDHPAIMTRLIPAVKILSTKPKPKTVLEGAA